MSQQEPAKVHPINSSATAATKTKPERTRAKPNYVLPTDRITCEKQLTLLRGYAAVSGHSKKPAKINEVAEASKISATTISLANGFFVEVGLVQKTDAGFVPSDEVAAFALAHEWKADTAALKLAPIIRQSWFAERVRSQLSMASVHENELMDTLAMAAGVGPDFRPRIKLLLDWLVVTGVAEREGDSLKKGTQASGSAPAPAHDKAAVPANVEPKDVPQRDGQSARSGVNSAFTQMTGGAIQFNISVKVEMAEFENWQPELVTAFFGGIAAVLSAKAAVEKAAGKKE